jgi:hypothetical protein
MSDFEIKDLTVALERQKAGPFHLSDLYGADWEGMAIGDRVKAGNAFLRHVGEGNYPMVEDSGDKDERGHMYVRRG